MVVLFCCWLLQLFFNKWKIKQFFFVIFVVATVFNTISYYIYLLLLNYLIKKLCPTDILIPGPPIFTVKVYRSTT